MVRAVWALARHPPMDFLYSDMEGYVGRAIHMASGAALDRSLVLQPPGTHLLLALPMKVLGTERAGLWGGATLWWALSSATPVLTWRLSRRFFSPMAAALAALLCALYPLNITFTGYFSAETPGVALLLVALLIGDRVLRAQDAPSLELVMYLGLAMGLVMIVRPQMLFNLLIVALPVMWRFRRQAGVLAALLAGGLLVMGPVLVLNARAAGEVVGISDYDGFNFFFGHCDARRVAAGPVYRPASPVNEQLDRGVEYSFPKHPPGDKSFYFKEGLECIKEDGFGHLELTALHVRDMTYTTIPHPHEHDPAVRTIAEVTNRVFCLLLPVIVVGTLLSARRLRRSGRSDHRVTLLLHLGCMLPMAVLFFGDPRYRFVYDVFGLILLATLIADRFGPGVEIGPEAEAPTGATA